MASPAGNHDPLSEVATERGTSLSVATDATVQSTIAGRKLRLRKGKGRDANSVGTRSKQLPKIPSPLSTVLMSDSESEAGKTPCLPDKENLRPTDDEACDADLDEEVGYSGSCRSKPLSRGTQKEQAVVAEDPVINAERRTRSAARKTTSDATGSSQIVSSTRERKAHSAVVSGTRRLPPLAESTQLIPDSFFQDELDRAVDQAYANFQRREDYPGFKRPTMRQRSRRRR